MAKRGPANRIAAARVLEKPLRLRILGWLAGQSQPRTQREIGRALSLSNAAVHYHLKRLEEAGLVKFEGTRPGPNSIMEKLYSGKPFTAPAASGVSPKQRSEFYLRYTLDSIRELHREGENLIRSDWKLNRFLVGCYGVYATPEEIRALKARLMELLEPFFEAHRRPAAGKKPFALTFGLLPSSGLAWTRSQSVFDMLG